MKNIGGAKVAYTCNPSYSGSGDWGHQGSRPAQAKKEKVSEAAFQTISWVWRCTSMVPAMLEAVGGGSRSEVI
jgi:hypothetical protein